MPDEPNLAPGTYVTYEGAFRNYIVPGLGTKRLDQLQPTHVQVWLNKVRQTCQCCAQGKDERRPLGKRRCCAIGECCKDLPSAVSVVQLRRILRAILTCAMEAGHISRNVAKMTKLPTVRRSRRRAWTSAEARRFLDHASREDSRFYAAYVLVLVLGLRKGEVLGLTWGQIDLEQAELVPSFQVQRVGKRLLRREGKSEGSEQALPLPVICLAALVRHLQAREALGFGVGPDDPLFTTLTGSFVEPRNFNRFWDRRVVAAGVPRITVHDARRTCATLLRDLEVHPRVAQRILRHAQVTITLDVYTEVTDDATREALRRLGETLGE